DTEVTALGVRRRAVLTHSPSLHAQQSRGFDQTLAKARRRLAELQGRLARGKTRRDRDAVAAEIPAIYNPRRANHVLTTTLTDTVAHPMPRQPEQAGLHMSVRELLDTLAGIQESVLLFYNGGKGRPRARRMLTDMTPTQQRLAEIFDIARYAPTR